MTILTLNESFIDPYQESQQPTPFPSTAAAPLPASSYHQNMVDDSQNMDFVVDISSAASSSAINKDNAAVKAAAAAATTELEKDLPSSSSSALQKQKHQHSNIATTTTAAAVLDDEVELPSSQPPQPHRTQKSSARILASLPKPTSALGDFFDSLIDSVPTYTNTNTSAAVVATTFTPGANKV